uniref:Non-specific lipid-transfer protein-like protein At2g13820 n=1 Tax=Rhizophora mucronata TaxID=61149 RepID=A0A2P2QRP5_RHIMU
MSVEDGRQMQDSADAEGDSTGRIPAVVVGASACTVGDAGVSTCSVGDAGASTCIVGDAGATGVTRATGAAG